jgi:hypothetical protein
VLLLNSITGARYSKSLKMVRNKNILTMYSMKPLIILYIRYICDDSLFYCSQSVQDQRGVHWEPAAALHLRGNTDEARHSGGNQ